MNKQPLLDLFNQQCEFSNYMAKYNEVAIVNLQSFNQQFTHIYGPKLSGKTHLLQAWLNLAVHKKHNGIYLDANLLRANFLTTLDLDLHRFIAIDNIDNLNDELQIELFDLFNKIKLYGRSNYLLTSSSVNLNLSSLRDDLRTRISSGVIFGLKSLNDDDLLEALNIYVKREGINYGLLELQYLINHYPRNLGLLIALINQTANYALSQKRVITIPLIKQSLLYK